MPLDPKQSLIVTISGDRPIGDVVNDLQAGGFEVDQVLEAIGSVTGAALPHSLPALRSLPGVADVSPDYTVDIGPPGAPVS